MFEATLHSTSGGLDSPEQCSEDRPVLGGTESLPSCCGKLVPRNPSISRVPGVTEPRSEDPGWR